MRTFGGQPYITAWYNEGERSVPPLVRAGLLDRAWRVDLGGVRQMLDIAGGSGIDSITFAQRQPMLQTTVFDLPSMVPFVREIIARYGLQERVTASPGNYFPDDLAGGERFGLTVQ